jgi:VanZ like family
MTGNVLGPLDYMFGETLRVAVAVAVALAGWVGVVGRVRGWSVERAARAWLLLTSVAAIALFTQHNPFGQSGRALDLNPFGDVKVAVNTTGRYRDIVIANIVLFIPLGVALAWRGRRFVRTVTLAAALSLGMEVLQYASNTGRVAQTGDVIVNAAGAVIGWAVFVALTGGWGPLTRDRRDAPRPRQRQPIS